MDKIDWDEVTAISTAGAAGFTAVMAWFTRKAIQEGQGQRKEANDHYAKTRDQDKLHHEDTYRPLVVLNPNSKGGDRQELLVIHPYFQVVVLDCHARNIGTGPALNVRLSVRSEGRVGLGPTRELSPMAADDYFKDSDGYISLEPHFSDTFNQQDLNNVPKGLWLLVLEYEDIFGNTFHTIHAKQKDAAWTHVGRGGPSDTTP